MENKARQVLSGLRSWLVGIRYAHLFRYDNDTPRTPVLDAQIAALDYVLDTTVFADADRFAGLRAVMTETNLELRDHLMDAMESVFLAPDHNPVPTAEEVNSAFDQALRAVAEVWDKSC